MMALLGPGASGEQGSPAVLFGAGFRRRAQVSPARASAVATSPARQSRRRRPRLEPPNGPPDGCGVHRSGAARPARRRPLIPTLPSCIANLRPGRSGRPGASAGGPALPRAAASGRRWESCRRPRPIRASAAAGLGGDQARTREGQEDGWMEGRTEGRRDGGTEGRRDGGTEGRREGGKEGRSEREPQRGRERGRERGPAHAHAHTNGLGRAHKNTGRDGERGERESPLALVRLSVARYENACLRLHARTHAHSAAKSAQTCFNERARTRPPPHPLPSPPREPHVFC